jgi:hypothetical protein
MRILPFSRLAIVTIVPDFLGVAILAVIYYKIATGKAWARSVFVIIFLISLIFLGWSLYSGSFGRMPVSDTLSVVADGLDGYVIYTLFTPTANKWFRERSNL